MSRLPLRVRLVAGFSAAMLVVLVAAGAFVYWRVQFALDRGLDADLAAASRTITPLVGSGGAVQDRSRADATGAGWQVLAADGTVLAHGGPVGGDPLVERRALASVPSSGALTRDLGRFLPASASPYRVRVVRADRGTYALVAVPRARRDEALRELLLQLGLAGLGALVLTALVGDRLARSALVPVERYRRRAEEIADGAVGRRLDVPARRDDEVTRLGHTLNDMLGALERSVERERRFVDEASHELRTPLTLLTSRVQLARRRPRTVAEHEQVLDELGLDVARLSALAEQLLVLGAAGGAGGSCEAVGVTNDVAGRWPTGRADADLAVHLPVGPLPVAVAPAALERVLTNLLANAAHYGAPPVEVTLAPAGPSWVRLLVVDAGPGMPDDLLSTATQRFARSPGARARPGAGLGLAIVEAVVDAAGAELRLCHAGRHHRRGVDTGVGCDHDEQMTVTVLLPRGPR